MDDNSTQLRSLQVAIVGAGIAGLGAAISLLRAGHAVEIFERSSFKNEIGAAITMSPNANLILNKWGLDAEEAQETEKMQCRFVDPVTLQLLKQVKYDGLTERFGGLKFNAFHRVDLHSRLRELAENAGAKIYLGKKAVSLDCEKGSMQFEDGHSIQKDLIVVADGFRSTFITSIVEEDIVTHKIGAAVFRTLIPIEKLMADPETRVLYENQASGFCTAMMPQKGVLFVTYPCRNDKLMNVAVFHQKKAHEAAKEDWNSPASVDEIMEVLNDAGFHPAWKNLVKQADVVNCYDLGIRDVLPRVNNGKSVLIGDAAHPMQPSFAQGACVSLEDAAALEVLFSQAAFDKRKHDVESRLQLFNQFRLPRNNVTQLMSNRWFHEAVFQDSAKSMNDRIRTFWDGEMLSVDATGWDKDTQDFFFWYDTYEQARRALHWKDDPQSMPRSAIAHFGVASGVVNG